MDYSLFCRVVREELSSDVSFLGNNHKEIVQKISNQQFSNIFSWLKRIVSQEIRALHPKRGQQYKGVPTNELLVFRYALNIEGVAYRVLLVKIKNEFFWEFHLGKHDYYDDVRKKLSLK